MKEKIVSKVEGETATLQWNIIKNDTVELFSADLYLLGSPDIVLYRLGGDKQPSKERTAQNLFGERITASITDSKTYVVTLKDVNYNESNSFKLDVGIRVSGTGFFSEATIKLIVTGMLHIIFLFLKSESKMLSCYVNLSNYLLFFFSFRLLFLFLLFLFLLLLLLPSFSIFLF